MNSKIKSSRRKKRSKRLTQDYLDVFKKPEHNCWAFKQLDTVDNFEALTAFDVIIYGAPGTPYEYGTFDVHIDAKSYPYQPPKVTFKTLVYHICISQKGKTCLQVCDGWESKNTLRDVLKELYQMLEDDPLRSPNMLALTINEQALNHLLANPHQYNKVARSYTMKYAMARVCLI